MNLGIVFPVRIIRTLLTVTLLFIFAAAGTAQILTKGKITGTVIDSETGEPILGANVFITGTTIGSATDLDGRYTISIEPGTYTVTVSCVAFTKKAFPGIKLTPGQLVVLNVVLDPTVIETEEIVVEAEAKTAYEAALLAKRKKAVAVSDGISAEQMKRTPDFTSGDALKRLVGITLVDNKFVFVRGVTDRYNETMINGTPVASTDAEKKGFSFDLLPSNLLENAIVVKSATPDLPADFTGGLVQLNTLDFPDRFTLKISTGSGYNSLTTGKAFLGSQSGKTDWLGVDDGKRSLPDVPADLTTLARELPNTWAPHHGKAPVNSSFSLALGDAVPLHRDNEEGGEFGFIGGLSYKSNFQTNSKIQDDKVGRFNTGGQNKYDVLWGGLLNLSYKPSPNHKFSFRNTYNQSGTDQVTNYQSTDYNTTLENLYTIIEWNQRKVYSGQLTGEHSLPQLFGLKVDWRGSVSSSRGETPDRKEITYYRGLGTSDPFSVAINQRSWATLTDRTLAGALDLSLPVGGIKVKSGLFGENQKAAYRIRFFNVVPDYFGGIPNSLIEAPLDQVYDPSHFGSGKFLFQESSKASDSYAGRRGLIGTYLMADIPFSLFSEKFRIVGGVRMEHSRQIVDVPKTFTPGGAIESTTLEGTEWLPSLNLTYSFNSATNLRFAFSKSLNRPEFREIASTGFYDFVRYELIKGNRDLQYAKAENVDVRLEVFPEAGELVAVSYFTKTIRNAIEEKLEQGAVRTRSWFNSAMATNSGWEFELRKSFDIIADYLSQSSLNVNYTRVFSQVQVDQVEGNSSGTTVSKAVRPMQGQSPYVVNVSLLFVEPTWGTSVNILFNRFGKRLDAVGFLAEDIFEQPRSVVDLALAQPLMAGYEIKLTVRNLTNQDRVLTRGDGIYELTSFGVSYGLGLSKTF